MKILIRSDGRRLERLRGLAAARSFGKEVACFESEVICSGAKSRLGVLHRPVGWGRKGRLDDAVRERIAWYRGKGRRSVSGGTYPVDTFV